MSSVNAGFVAGPAGKLSISVFLPEQQYIPVHWVIHVPAFAEEMNKSRAMISLHARQMADTGVAVVVPDLYGTGDSEGEFDDAHWKHWKSDLDYLILWAQGQGAGTITLWGLRLGCLLALDVVQKEREIVSGLLLWQPVLSGKLHLGQFLRLRMASAMMSGAAESVGDLRELLLQGQTLEVAGYQLSAELFAQLETVSAANLVIPRGLKIRVAEVVASADKPPLPVTLKQLELWQRSGVDGSASSHPGDPFWMTQEIAYAHALGDATWDYLAAMNTAEEQASGKGEPGTLRPSLFPAPTTGPGDTEAVVFPCAGEELVGILHRSEGGTERGVMIVVGGPQYRVGSHRQFVYLARALSEAGIPVFCFDYRGMGDSSGTLVGFDGVGTDIGSAIDAFQQKATGLTEVVLWGLCDAATASVFYAQADSRVKGMVLVNPWVYSSQGAAKAYLKHYYLDRFMSRAFWKKVFSGGYNPFSSASSLIDIAVTAAKPKPEPEPAKAGDECISAAQQHESQGGNLAQRFAVALDKFKGPVLVILSGNDLTASEFSDAVSSNRDLSKAMKRKNLRQESLPEADHTFSKQQWRIT
ncbi:MAG: hydrolase 1, exosortase A system-associated, partial [Halioglobus sp.]